MKLVFGILIILLCSTNAFALDASILEESYPGFSNYELNSFTATRSYFRTLFSHSVQYSDLDGALVLDVQNDDWESILKIRILIEREIFDYDIIEHVVYQLSNGNKFEYILRREGKNLSPLKDQDLLMFKFQAEDSYDSYDILIPTFDIHYHRENTKDAESSYFLLGNLNFKMQIDTKLSEAKIVRDYIFFYEEMPSPQTELSVQVTMMNSKNSDANGIEFMHYMKEKGVINPKIFFDGLKNSSMMFSRASQFYLENLNSLGFPKFE